MPKAPPQRLLVVRLGAIGDVVNALVFASAMKARFPAIHLAWVVHPLARPLVDGHPDVDQVHVWKRSGGFGELRRLLGQLRQERYDVAVDLQRITKSALLASLSGAARVLGYDRGHAKEMSWFWTNERLHPEAIRSTRGHMVDHYMSFARHLGADGEPKRRLPVDPKAEEWADEVIGRLGAAPVLLNVGASKPANRWPAERFGELAAELETRGAGPLVLLGGPGDERAAREAHAAAGSSELLDLAGETDLPQLTALARRAKLFIGCDTGPMHIAAAVKTPVLALFGPADPTRTGPFGNGHRVLSVPTPCAPCGRKTCNQPRHACMEDIPVELVLAEAEDALQAAGT